MTEVELRAIFAFLNHEFNKDNLLYFKLLDANNVGAYFRNTNKLFATFYLNRLKKYIEPVSLSGTKEVKINHICDATRILAQYEEWLKEGINYKYGKWERHTCLKFFNKLQEIKERIVNEKEKIQSN